eukprot:ANDGO_00393.mRNA.1 putative manganese-transporting ATPase PDR2
MGRKEFVLLRARPVWARRDMLPFVVAYVLNLIGIIAFPDWDFWLLVALGCEVLCHVLSLLSTQWSFAWAVKASFDVVSASQISVATNVWIKYAKKNQAVSVTSKSEICQIQICKQTRQRFVLHHMRRFTYDDDKKVFAKSEFPIHLPSSEYAHAKSLSIERHRGLADLYGPNKFTIPVPSFWPLFQQHLFAPFFVFQLFCISLWFLDEYWYYSLFTLGMLVLMESVVVKQRQGNLSQMRAVAQKPASLVYVLRAAQWSRVSCEELVPGDIVSVHHASPLFSSPHKSHDKLNCPADLLLLEGDVVVSEAMLTGESKPLLKKGIETSSVSFGELSVQKHRDHILFGGTTVLRSFPSSWSGSIPSSAKKKSGGTALSSSAPAVSSGPAPDGGCKAYVLRTGFETEQGKLIRKIVFASDKAKIESAEAYVFLLVLFLCALVAAVYLFKKSLELGEKSFYNISLDCILILTSVVPPELPMELSLAVNHSLILLAKGSRVFCTEPFRIPMAGKVDTCAFDKTGTLTSDDMRVEQIVPSTPDKSKRDAERILAACHSLVWLDSEQPVGDAMEVAAFDFVRWKRLDKDYYSADSKVEKESVKILHRFGFDADLRRMSVFCGISKAGSADVDDFAILTKGAPETMREMFNPASFDAEKFDVMCNKFTASGARVLALGMKVVGDSANLSRRYKKALQKSNREGAITNFVFSALISKASCSLDNEDEHEVICEEADLRQAAEAGLSFAGFVLFVSPLKKDTAASIEELILSGHDCIMVTGDNARTATAVAIQCGIISKSSEKEILQLSVTSPDGAQFGWVDQQDAAIKYSLFGVPHKNFEFVISGEVLRHMSSTEASNVLKEYASNCHVFARMAPSQKEDVIHVLQAVDRQILFCGDGTNDVGALKASHVGIAIVSKEMPADIGVPRLQNFDEETILKDPMLRRARDLQKFLDGPVGTRMTDSRKEQIRGMITQIEELRQENENFVAQLGDASIAAPFTSKRSSIRCALDIVRQGRCTLVTTLQIYSILALQCLLNAYTLSVLHLQGLKFGDRQMTVASIFTALMFFLMSRPQPVERLSRERPFKSIFSPYFILSVFGQFLLHLSCLLFLVYVLLPSSLLHAETPQDVENLRKEFSPSILNTVLFPFSCILQVATFTINYRGEPFMQPLKKNKAFIVVSSIAFFMFLSAATGSNPEFNELFQLVELPRDIPLWIDTATADSSFIASLSVRVWSAMLRWDLTLPNVICGVIVFDVAVAFFWDRVLRLTYRQPVVTAPQ